MDNITHFPQSQAVPAPVKMTFWLFRNYGGRVMAFYDNQPLHGFTDPQAAQNRADLASGRGLEVKVLGFPSNIEPPMTIQLNYN